MPPDAAGSLEEDEYLAIKDYIFDLKYSGSIQKIEKYPTTQSFKVPNKENRPEIPWQHFGGKINAQRYLPIDQIDNENVKDLEIAWRWKSKEFGNFQGNKKCIDANNEKWVGFHRSGIDQEHRCN